MNAGSVAKKAQRQDLLWVAPLDHSGAARFLAALSTDSGREGGTMISFRSLPVRLSEIEFAKKARDKLSPGALILLFAVAIAGNDAFSAEDAVSAGDAVSAEDVVSSVKVPLTEPELNALLANGLSVSSTDMLGGKYFTAKMNYAINGTLSGAVTFSNGKAPIDVKGTWKLDGARVCRTILPFQPEEVCETWLKSGSNEVTVRVGDINLAVSRWQ